jgi:hypothetical protein
MHVPAGFQSMPDRLGNYPAWKARGASINLRRPWQRLVFFAGLAGAALLALLAALFR